MPVRVWTTLLLVGACVAAACGSSSHSGSGTASTSSTNRAGGATLVGTSWDLQTYSAAGKMVPAAASASLAFEQQSKLSGSTGCNSFTGTYSVSGTTLKITLGVMTAMGCVEPARQAQETAVTKQLPMVTAYAIDNGTLTLTGSASVKLLVYSAASRALTGTAWNVTGVNNGKGAVASTTSTEKLTATFGAGGEFSGFGGCNQLGGEYTLSGANGLSIGPLRSTAMACGTAIDQLEAQYSTALSHVASYEIAGTTLTLRDKNGATQVTAQRL